MRQQEILDTKGEQCFDDITALVAFIFDTPIALFTLVDKERQWFKSKVGLGASETHRNAAFCAHTILQADVMVVPDALADPRFADNPLVTADPNIRFYAGAPLLSREGYALGSLCVIDRVPRQTTPAQHQALAALSRQVTMLLGLRRVSADLANVVKTLKTLHGYIPICSYCKGIRDDKGSWRRLEEYVHTHTEAEFSHGICPECLKTVHKKSPSNEPAHS